MDQLTRNQLPAKVWIKPSGTPKNLAQQELNEVIYIFMLLLMKVVHLARKFLSGERGCNFKVLCFCDSTTKQPETPEVNSSADGKVMEKTIHDENNTAIGYFAVSFLAMSHII